MAPQLVVASAPSVEYPGGVIAVRAADWIAPGSTTASSESHALASTGQVVRETQQVVSPNAPNLTEPGYEIADDTLVMAAADIGLEPDFFYDIWISVLIEGDRDLTERELLNDCSNYRWQNVALAGVHGTEFQTDEFPFYENTTLFNVPHFWPIRLGIEDFVDVDNDIIRFRFLSQVGTTVEWLIDQVIFIPAGNFDDWVDGQDMRFMFSDRGIPPETPATPPVDGDDGGDANGKFTYNSGFAGDSVPVFNDGSDYQRKDDGDDAEYDQIVTEALHDEQLFNSITDEESPAYGYSYHNVRVRDQRNYVEDTFDNRTTTVTSGEGDMGISPDGYGIFAITNQGAGTAKAYVDGSKGVLELNNKGDLIELRWGYDGPGAFGTDPNMNHGSVVQGHGHWQWSGEMEWASGVAVNSGNMLRIFILSSSDHYEIRLRMDTLEWSLYQGAGLIDGPNDASSFFSSGASFGFRIEQLRYVFRFRFWDAGGAEPSTWDYEDFWHTAGGVAYPYSDSESTAQTVNFVRTFRIQFNSDFPGIGDTVPFILHLHNWTLSTEPYGDPASAYVRIERPPGTSLGDIEIPYGCPYMVYWGPARDWTEPDSADIGSAPEVEFNMLTWNDTDAAETQRIVTHFEWFRVLHPSGVMSMNWSYGKNADIRRVHV